MSKDVEFEGVVHQFPDDFTDAEIAAALQGGAPATTGPTMTATTPMGRAKNAIQNLQGVPGILVGAGNELVNMARGTWNFLAPESLDVANPDRPDTNPWQMAGVRGTQGAMLASSVPKVPGILAKAGGVSKARAVENLNAVDDRVGLMGRAMGQPITVESRAVGQAGARAQELASRAGTNSAPVNKLMKRLAQGTDLTFAEAKDFVSNLSALSAKESMKVNPKMHRQISEIAQVLRQAMTEAAETVGKGDQYARGVREYGRAMAVQNAAKKAGIVGGGALGAEYLLRRITDALKSGATTIVTPTDELRR